MSISPPHRRPLHRARLFARGSWLESSRAAEILRAETTGGLLLIGAATIAIVWANTPGASSYADLIAGDGRRHSHALLGIFDAIAPAAAAALDALGQGDEARFRAILDPTVPLSRRIFEAPTRFYKAGVVFMAWLNGHQSHFTMVGGMESARSIVHYADVFRLAAEAGLLRDPELAVSRMRKLAAVHGIS